MQGVQDLTPTADTHTTRTFQGPDAGLAEFLSLEVGPIRSVDGSFDLQQASLIAHVPDLSSLKDLASTCGSEPHGLG